MQTQIHKNHYANTNTQYFKAWLRCEPLQSCIFHFVQVICSNLRSAVNTFVSTQHFKLQMIERLSQINFKLKLGKKGLLRGGIGDLVEDVKQWGWNWAFSCLRWYLAIYSWRHNSNCNWLISCYVCSLKRVVTGIFHVCGYFLIIL